MYEELLPFWKQFTKAYDPPDVDMSEWVVVLARHGFTHKIYKDGSAGWEWINHDYKSFDCLVGGVILFTWEAGMEP